MRMAVAFRRAPKVSISSYVGDGEAVSLVVVELPHLLMCLRSALCMDEV